MPLPQHRRRKWRWRCSPLVDRFLDVVVRVDEDAREEAPRDGAHTRIDVDRVLVRIDANRRMNPPQPLDA